MPLRGDLETRVQARLNEAFPEGSSTNGDYYARHGVPDRILIAREARQVMGHLAVYPRQVKMGAKLRYRGRVNSLYNMIFKGGSVLGVALFGGLAQLTDVRLSSAMAAIVLVLLMLRILRQDRASPAASR